jgi:hypothetical protein
MNHLISVDIIENCRASLPEDHVQRAWNVVKLDMASNILLMRF